MACDALAFKAIRLLSYDIAASGLIYSLNFSLSSIITEVYGFNLSGRIIWVQLICHIFFVLIVNLVSVLPSPVESTTYTLYFNLFHNFRYILLGSCLAMPIAYFVNDIIVSKLKVNLYGKRFIFRFLVSSTIGGFILVMISYPINFYGQYSFIHILHIAINTWVYKILSSIILLPISLYLIDLLKRVEKTDYYDYGVSYNPLNVFSTEESGENRYGSKEKISKNYSTHRHSSI